MLKYSTFVGNDNCESIKNIAGLAKFLDFLMINKTCAVTQASACHVISPYTCWTRCNISISIFISIYFFLSWWVMIHIVLQISSKKKESKVFGVHKYNNIIII